MSPKEFHQTERELFKEKNTNTTLIGVKNEKTKKKNVLTYTNISNKRSTGSESPYQNFIILLPVHWKQL